MATHQRPMIASQGCRWQRGTEPAHLSYVTKCRKFNFSELETDASSKNEEQTRKKLDTYMESLSLMKFCLWSVLLCGTGLLVGFKGTAGQQCSGNQGGRFVLVFSQDSLGPPVNLSIIIIPRPSSLSTSVSTSINNSDNKKEAILKKGDPATFEYPNLQQIIGSGISSGSMIINSNDDITVMSRNFVGTSGDIALHYPVDQWGTKYTIFTPTDGPSKHYAQFAVVAQHILTTLTIVLSGTVYYNGKNYNKGDTMTVDLKPFQFVQLQSKDNLSGTEVASQHPVAIISGHSCVPGVGGCSLVYEQLLPEKNWGKSYCVSVPSFLSSDSQVYVLGSKPTYLEYQSGEEKLTTNLEAGKPMKFKVSASKPLSIHSTENIQVFLYGFSGNFEGKPFGSFLTKIPDTESFFHNYSLIGQKGFDNNLAIITAKASSVSGFLFNGKPLQNAEWKAIPNTEYVSSEINYGGGFSSNTMQNPIAPFGLVAIGYSVGMAYGTVAAGIQAPVCPLLYSIGSGPINYI
ncbi:IgGFc-binding protein-like isoform X1 [Ranitomeya variabilis]|uniref:IgGFc-binding protein-like isoform X1 n=1 Tax=Ranitomeya variabilis TaxID=490064 RepID=UPI004055F921